MGVKLLNNTSLTLGLALADTDESLVVPTGTGGTLPVLLANEYYYATIISASGYLEIVKIVGRVGDVISLTRAQEGTTAKSFPAGSRIELRVTAASINDAISAAIAAALA